MNRKRNNFNKWMPLDLHDLSNQRIDLTPTQFAGYINLIVRYWSDGKPLPDDDVFLRKVSGLSLSIFKKHKTKLLDSFELIDSEAGWIHPHYQEELSRVKAVSEQKSKAARARWDAPAMHMHKGDVSICNANTRQDNTLQSLPVGEAPAAAPDLQPPANKIRGGGK